ncbi:polynucleotide adenylyltransferase PcnB [Marinospirillum alkaliphilum]|uniref:Poly(A) polymerase I n=1 Tax=Marinospirillum alkaliphilum DSM 21637 TaxID=1122209 RepID=A0A1K1WJX6_9GAMM|nr:polynucleotide adenylyltransferase PcnB [Marinospirillum alkaliphilum]SFX37085.1 poly(A) polymerase [Marinospirillum alkaliphilum DSM 21637]
MIKGITRYIRKRLGKAPVQPVAKLQILPRSEHPISRSEIPEGALKVLYRLHKAGFQAYLVGGCIRDRLLGKTPKDFDVATDATPEQVNHLFRNSRMIGRRFRIVHVRFGREIIEVTTFRGQANEDESKHLRQSDEGMLLRDNVWGNIEEDALRRDFTINALYYNVADFAIHDFTGGLEDLKSRTLRLIGDPDTRYREDPVRMLRAVRFAAKLGFHLDPATEAPIREQASLLLQVAPARMFDEVLKLFLAGHALDTFRLLKDYGLFAFLFPASAEAFKVNPTSLKLVEQALINTDQRIADERPVTPAFLYAALLWPGLELIYSDLLKNGVPPFPAMQQAGNRLLQRQQQHITIPKRFAFPMREIWDLQLKLPQRHGKRAWELLHQPRFRAAYDFLLLRETAGEATDGLAEWWTRFQDTDEAGQQRLLENLGKSPARSKTANRKRGPRRRRKPADTGSSS